MEIYKWMAVDGILDESRSNLISCSLKVNFLVDQLSDISLPSYVSFWKYYVFQVYSIPSTSICHLLL